MKKTPMGCLFCMLVLFLKNLYTLPMEPYEEQLELFIKKFESGTLTQEDEEAFKKLFSELAHTITHEESVEH